MVSGSEARRACPWSPLCNTTLMSRKCAGQKWAEKGRDKTVTTCGYVTADTENVTGSTNC